MSNLQKVRYIFEGLIMMIGAVAMIMKPESGYLLIGAILGFVLVFEGIRCLWFYFSMAKNMVGGRVMLYRGIISLDLGMFALSLQFIPPIYLLLYLLVINLFSGIVAVLRALETKRMGGRWRLGFAYGLANILLAFSCTSCLKYPEYLAYVYAVGLFYTACLRIAQAFRKTAIIYIP